MIIDSVHNICSHLKFIVCIGTEIRIQYIIYDETENSWMCSISSSAASRNNRPHTNERTNERTRQDGCPTNHPTNQRITQSEQTTNPFACQMKSIQSDWNASCRRFEMQTYHLVNYLPRNTPKCFENGFTNSQRCHNFLSALCAPMCWSANAQCKPMTMSTNDDDESFWNAIKYATACFSLKFHRTNQRQKLFV